MRNRNKGQTERGEVMLESMIVVIITIFVLVWLLALGFVYYQRYLVTVVTNDAASKIAATYNNPTSDIIMGYISSQELKNRDLYRHSGNDLSTLEETNQNRAESYVKYVLKKTNFVGVVDPRDVTVKLKTIHDTNLRRHVEVTTTAKFKTPLGIGMRMVRMKDTATYTATGCAECTDFADYISTTDYSVAWQNGVFLKGTGIIESTVKLINSIIKLVTKQYTT